MWFAMQTSGPRQWGHIRRNHSVNGVSQCETMLQCNVLCQWLSPNIEWKSAPMLVNVFDVIYSIVCCLYCNFYCIVNEHIAFWYTVARWRTHMRQLIMSLLPREVACCVPDTKVFHEPILTCSQLVTFEHNPFKLKSNFLFRKSTINAVCNAFAMDPLSQT